MQTTLNNQGVQVTRLIQVNPDHLIELGHRLKKAAMDYTYPGQSVLVQMTDEIMLLYVPEREFCKPLHRLSDQQPRLGIEE